MFVRCNAVSWLPPWARGRPVRFGCQYAPRGRRPDPGETPEVDEGIRPGCAAGVRLPACYGFDSCPPASASACPGLCMLITWKGQAMAQSLQPVQRPASCSREVLRQPTCSRLSRCGPQAATHQPQPVQRAASIRGSQPGRSRAGRCAASGAGGDGVGWAAAMQGFCTASLLAAEAGGRQRCDGFRSRLRFAASPRPGRRSRKVRCRAASGNAGDRSPAGLRAHRHRGS